MQNNAKYLARYFQDKKSKSFLFGNCSATAACELIGQIFGASGFHPNLLHIASVNNKIPVDDVRKINSFLSTTSYVDQPKIVLIDRAEYLNLSASNALLKCLEEPGRNAYFILLTNNHKGLLKTIQSRCVYVGFDGAEPVSSALYKDVLGALSTGAVFKVVDKYINKKEVGVVEFGECVKTIVHQVVTMPSVHDEISKLAALKSREEWVELYFKLNRLFADTKTLNLSAYNNAVLGLFMVGAKA